jgi:hypothetical protein
MVNTSVMRTAEDHSHHSRRSTFRNLETPGARTEEMSAFGSADAINEGGFSKPRGTTGDTPPLAAKPPHRDGQDTHAGGLPMVFFADATYFLTARREVRGDAIAQFQPTDKQSRFGNAGCRQESCLENRMDCELDEWDSHLFRFRKKPSLCVGHYLEDANNKTVTVFTSTEIVREQRGRFDRGILKLRRRAGLALRLRASKIPRYK